MRTFNTNSNLTNVLLASLWGSLLLMQKNNISKYQMQST